MAGVEASMLGVSRGATGSSLSVQKLQNAFSSLVIQTTGTNRSVGMLISTLGSFAAGGGIMLGVTAGIAAVAGAYDLITKGAREAKKETDDFIKSLVDQTKAAYNASVAGKELAMMRAGLELEAAKRANPVGARSVIGSILTGSPMIAAADAEVASKRISDAQIAVNQATKNYGETWTEAQKTAGVATSKAKSGVDELKFGYMALRNEIERVRASSEQMGKEFWRNIINVRGEADELTAALTGQLGPEKPGPVDISSSARSAGAFAQEITDNAERNAQLLQGAILQSAQIIVSALNIGGGGRNSNLGGALGGTAGFAAGFIFGGGPVGGAIGSTVGSLIGSALGGLFDSNTKATRDNTSATRALIQAMTLNEPRGFKAEPYRHGASVAASRSGSTVVNIDARGSDAKEIARLVGKYATRGGAPLFSGA